MRASTYVPSASRYDRDLERQRRSASRDRPSDRPPSRRRRVPPDRSPPHRVAARRVRAIPPTPRASRSQPDDRSARVRQPIGQRPAQQRIGPEVTATGRSVAAAGAPPREYRSARGSRPRATPGRSTISAAAGHPETSSSQGPASTSTKPSCDPEAGAATSTRHCASKPRSGVRWPASRHGGRAAMSVSAARCPETSWRPRRDLNPRPPP